jgi:hypothetical protein
MDEIDATIGFAISKSLYSRDVFFYSLFAFIYDQLYGLGSDLSRKAKARSIDRNALQDCLLNVGEAFKNRNVPEDVVDAVERASSDYGRRHIRHQYLRRLCG